MINMKMIVDNRDDIIYSIRMAAAGPDMNNLNKPCVWVQVFNGTLELVGHDTRNCIRNSLIGMLIYD